MYGRTGFGNSRTLLKWKYRYYGRTDVRNRITPLAKMKYQCFKCQYVRNVRMDRQTSFDYFSCVQFSRIQSSKSVRPLRRSGKKKKRRTKKNLNHTNPIGGGIVYFALEFIHSMKFALEFIHLKVKFYQICKWSIPYLYEHSRCFFVGFRRDVRRTEQEHLKSWIFTILSHSKYS
jgi:hypothetical protein